MGNRRFLKATLLCSPLKPMMFMTECSLLCLPSGALPPWGALAAAALWASPAGLPAEEPMRRAVRPSGRGIDGGTIELQDVEDALKCGALTLSR